MVRLIEKLQRDHANMAELLTLLAAQLNIMQDDTADANYPMMRDIARYFMAFPDTVHHPLEDEIFTLLEQKRPDLKPRLDRIRDDHSELADLGLEFYRLMEDVCSGQIVERNRIVSTAENFLACQQGHLETEEREIFPAAADVLTDQDLDVFEAAHGGRPDPVFSAELREGFAHLHDAIEAAR